MKNVFFALEISLWLCNWSGKQSWMRVASDMMRDKVLFSFLSFIYSAVAEHLTDHLGKIIRDYLFVNVTS